jgi:hypothetical protein
MDASDAFFATKSVMHPLGRRPVLCRLATAIFALSLLVFSALVYYFLFEATTIETVISQIMLDGYNCEMLSSVTPSPSRLPLQAKSAKLLDYSIMVEGSTLHTGG